MHEDSSATTRLSGLALAGIVVAILAAGLARGQDDWHAVLVLVGALLQIAAVVHATRRIWLGFLSTWRSGAPPAPASAQQSLPEGDRSGQIRLFALTPDEALVAGAMAIAGVLLTLAGNLLV